MLFHAFSCRNTEYQSLNKIPFNISVYLRANLLASPSLHLLCDPYVHVETPSWEKWATLCWVKVGRISCRGRVCTAELQWGSQWLELLVKVSDTICQDKSPSFSEENASLTAHAVSKQWGERSGNRGSLCPMVPPLPGLLSSPWDPLNYSHSILWWEVCREGKHEGLVRGFRGQA